MFFSEPRQLCRNDTVKLKNRLYGESEFRFSKAYAISDTAELVLTFPSNLGIYAPVLSIRRDGESNTAEIPFSFSDSFGGTDCYCVRFSPKDVTAKHGLLFFTVSFLSGTKSFSFCSINNVDGILVEKDSPDAENASEFRMLVYDDGYTVPEEYSHGVMYHIFVDRFCRGSRHVEAKPTAVINHDWENGVPQYGEKQGDFCANNMFFGGTLYGIVEKLDYIESLGVNILYLSPIFDAYSNHKYDTGDYEHVDSMFGGDEAFSLLISECEKRGIRIMLDGVFNHTGDDSRYFNRYGRYGECGAYQSRDSKYRDWFCFNNFPDDYDSWWGIKILPKLNGKSSEVREYLVGENGIVPKYLKKGVSGFRLDVADELTDEFLCVLRRNAKKAKSDCVIIGEVWENAADKVAYGNRRFYFCGEQLDGVMNYPIKNAITEFIMTADASNLKNAVCDIYSSYPEFVSASLMNLLGTHDTERVLTILGTNRYKGLSNRELSAFRMTDDEYKLAKRRLLCASVLQYTLPGVPSVFYGDEVGVQGGHDPFCRATFPWGKEDTELLTHYRALGKLRRKSKALWHGELSELCAENGIFSFVRKSENEKLTVTVNASCERYNISFEKSSVCLLCGKRVMPHEEFIIEPMTAHIFAETEDESN